MQGWRSDIRRRLARARLSRAREAEVVEELSQHLQDRFDELRAVGEDDVTARATALAELDEAGTWPTEPAALPLPIGLATGGATMRSVLWQDVRYAVRTLRKAPGFSAVVVITLALGIGATTAIFSAVRPILFAPLPYPDAGRIAMVWETFNAGGRQEGTFGMYAELQERARSFDAIAVLRPWQPTMTGPDQPERFDGQRVSAGYFRVLGLSPALGRNFEAAEDRFGGPRVVMLSDALWRRRFGADTAIIGRPIVLDGDPWTVVGVMPRRFENVLAPGAALWAPLQYDLREYSWGHHLRTVARLKPGIGVDQASREVDALGRALAKKK